MIKLNSNSKISELENKNEDKNKTSNAKTKGSSAIRPEVVDAKVYKVRSAFVKNSVFITLSYIITDLGRRPIEIFINSKDLTRAPEYVVLTRLVSAIFRRSNDPMFMNQVDKLWALAKTRYKTKDQFIMNFLGNQKVAITEL